MDDLQLFVSLRAIEEGRGDPDAFRVVLAELRRLENELAEAGEKIPRFDLEREDLDNLSLLKMRQSLEPEGKVRRIAPVRWCYLLVRKMFLGTQRRYNESVSYLLRRLYSATLLSRYYQVRALALEKRLDRLERQADEQKAPAPPPPEPNP